jgi:PAS domain S-box-containing protein
MGVNSSEANYTFQDILPAFLDLASDVFWIQDIQSGNRTWFGQPERLQQYGLSNGNGPDDQWLKKIHHDDRDRINQLFAKFLADKSMTSFQFEYCINGRDRCYFIRDRVKLERDADGEPKRLLGAWRDITELMEEKQAHSETHEIQKQISVDYCQSQALLREKKKILQRLGEELQQNYDALLRTEFMLNKSQEITRTGSWQLDLKTGKFSCSNEFYAIHGTHEAFDFGNRELLRNLYGADNSERLLLGLDRVKREGQPLDTTFRYVTSSGCQRWLRWIAYPLYNKETISEINGVVHDITPFKETEEKLRASEEKFFTLFKFNPDFMSLARESDGIIVDVNDKAQIVSGYTEAEMIGKTAAELNLWVDLSQMKEFFIQYSEQGKASIEATWKKKTGELLYILLSSVRLSIGNQYYRLSLVKDITSRKKAEEKFNLAFNLNPDLMFIMHEKDSIIVDININVTEVLGFTRDEVVGKTALDINLWVNPEERQKFFKQYLKEGKVSYETKFRKKNGQEIYAWVSSVRIQLFDEHFVLTSIKDITARMQAEKIFQTVFRSSPDMMALVRKKDGVLIDVNDHVYDSIGFTREELIGRRTDDLDIWFDNSEKKAAPELTITEPHVTYEARLKSKSGREVFVLVSSSLVEIAGETHILYLTKDITDRKRAENKLRYSEANLAATINNTNTVIWSIDTNYLLLAQNEASRQYTKKYFGKYLEIGQPVQVFDDVEDEATRKYWKEIYQRAFNGEHVTRLHEEFGRYFDVSINPIVDNDKVVGLTVFSMDITDRIAREQQVVKNLEHLAEAEKRIGELKLMSLRAAMNPHFIFNALNSIQFFITTNESEQAIQYLSTFSKLIRGILNASAQKKIRLSEELDLLRHYIHLEQVRFEDKFVVRFDIDRNIDKENIEVPSLLIQPFVENAIVHGLSHKESDGILSISAKQLDENRLFFQITDNGIGRDAAKKLQTSNRGTHRSLGVSLAEERLKMINGESHLTVETEDLYVKGRPAGTQVRIWFQLS